MSDGSVVIDTSLNNKGFIKGISSMKDQTGGLTSAVRKLGTVIASVFAVRQIVAFGKECVELGSNVAEVQNVVDVAFGDMAYKIEDFADTSIQNFGMSRLAAKKTASTYMAMARGMGINEQAASDMSISLTGLTGDVASFYNISQELADIKLKSVFTGETETLKDLGVVMTQANLKAYALSHGMSGNIESMTQSQLVMLRYRYVTDQLALAQGDFARTQDSWANQTRILSMQWQEFMSIMGQALITVLAPVVKMLNNIVSALISMANTFNSVVSGLFGGANTQIQQTQANAEAVGGTIEGSVGEQNSLTDATKETAKAQKKMLAGFDEVNKLTEGSAAGASPGGTSGAGAAAAPALAINEVEADAGKNSEILNFFAELQKAVQPSVDALGRLWDELKRVGSFTGDALKDFYETFLKPLGTWVLGEGFPRFVDAITNGLSKVNWQKINDALHEVWAALEPFAENVGEGLLWLWENVLVPFGTWTMNEVVPLFLEAVAAALGIFNAVWDAVKPGLEWLWDNFLLPIAQWTGGVIVAVLSALVGKLKDFSDWCSKHKETIENIALAVGTFVATWTAVNLVAKIGGVVTALAGFISSGGLATAATGALSTAMAFLAANPIVLVAAAIAGLVTGIVLLIKNWDTVKETALKVWEGIKTAWEGANTWFSETVTQPIETAFSGAWDNIKLWASTAWDNIKETFQNVSGWFDEHVVTPVRDGFKTFINGLIGNVESFVNFFVRGINKIVSALNNLNVEVPDWVPGIGGKSFGFDIPSISEMQLPRLATGAVIPPNREFLAVLGDQKQGTNIEAPLETLVQAFKIAAQEIGGGSGGDTTIIMEVDGQRFAKLVYNANKKESGRVGVRLVEV